jgi:hypothetical protein
VIPALLYLVAGGLYAHVTLWMDESAGKAPRWVWALFVLLWPLVLLVHLGAMIGLIFVKLFGDRR